MAFILHFISFILFIRAIVTSIALSVRNAFNRLDSDQSLHENIGWFLKKFIPWLLCFALAMLYTFAEIG